MAASPPLLFAPQHTRKNQTIHVLPIHHCDKEFRVHLFDDREHECPSGKVRHEVCINGVEDLPLLASSKQLIANKRPLLHFQRQKRVFRMNHKSHGSVLVCNINSQANMMPDFDHAVTSCISELLFNRTQDGSNIDRAFYENINSVRYHHERNLTGFNINEFNCEL